MDKPQPIEWPALPGINEYTCPKSCGCNKLVRWTFDNGPLQRFHTYCEGNGNKVHYVEYPAYNQTGPDKVAKLLYRLIAGVVFTDIEARPKSEIETAAWKMAMDVGMQVDAERLVSNMISHKVITLAATERGVEYYRHNLPNTLSHVYKPAQPSSGT